MGANTEYSRLDFIATEKLNAILDSQTLPTVSTSDAGKALVVGEDGKWKATLDSQILPTVTELDAGKVLIVGSDGKWKAATLEEAGIEPAESTEPGNNAETGE